MESSNQTCQNCKTQFAITTEDHSFYEKMKVPAPTWCPDCRAQRRMSFCNERNLYRVNCGLCGKNSISMYHPSAEFPIYCRECFWSDKLDATQYAQNYDFSKPFFQQFAELKKKVPRVALLQQGNMEGSDYTNRSSNAKNCYLCFRTNFSEDCYYAHPANDSKSIMDCLNVQKSELVYGSIDCVQCYNVAFCQETQNCNDSRFLYDCRGCSDCFGCANLRNKQYYIFNEPYSREDYFARLKEINLGDYSKFGDFKSKFDQFILKYIRPYMVSLRSGNVTGNWIYDSNNVLNSFGVRNVENSKNIYGIINAKDCMDYYFWGRECELIYEVASCGYSCSRIAFSNEVMTSCNELQYCDNSSSITDCFGCSGIRNKQFCILNKQYTEAEYKELLPKIIAHMNDMPYVDKKGRTYKYGEFFPTELSPFCYNETAAVEFFPLTREQALEKGFAWREPEVRDFGVTIKASELPINVADVSNDITKQVIGCAHEGNCQDGCSTAFKIIPQELEMYRKMNLPLPRLCPNCRHRERLRARNPLKLWPRSCDCAGKQSKNLVYNNVTSHSNSADCPNGFETSYAPTRPEIVYCEQCYQSEVV